MKLNRRSRIAAALFAVVSLLFMQLAVAAHACPGVSGVSGTPMKMDSKAAASMAGMADCDQTGQGRSNLCHEHCQASAQVADSTAHAGPDVPLRHLQWLAIVPSSIALPVRSQPASMRQIRRDARLGAPPPSQRLRVLRI